jgi:hypothetical protein
MIAVRVIVAMPVVVMRVVVAMPVLVTVAVIMRIVVMLVIVSGGMLVPQSWWVFVLVAVLELTVAVGMGVHHGHEARVPPAGRSLAALATTGLACARPVGYLHDCEGI